MTAEAFDMPLIGVRHFPFKMVKIPISCEFQAKLNHQQSFKRLKERGGLNPSEACAIIEQRRWKLMTSQEAEAVLKSYGAT